jgi:hypothetical protein
MIALEPPLRTAGSHRKALAVRALSFFTLLVIVCFLARTTPDADLWGHLKFGGDIVRAGRVHTADPYSFTSDRAWINHEWLAEVIMWSAYSVGGVPGLVGLKLALACTAGAALLASWRRQQLRPPVRDSLLFVTSIGVWPLLTTIRPQAFSVGLFAILLLILHRAREGSIRWLLALPVVFAIWVNVHGGWVVGAGTLAIFVGCSWFDPTWGARNRVLLLSAACASALATVCNPYGASLLGFLSETVRPARVEIIEWQPVTRVPLVGFVLWIVPTVAAGYGIWKQRRRPALASLLVVLLLAIGSFRVIRLVGFYALAVAFLIPPWTDDDRPRSESSPAWLRAALTCGALIAIAAAVFGRALAMNAEWLPEREAAMFIKEHDLRGRMLTWFDYGEFAIWHFSPAVRVSMDGRRETVYSEALRDRHFRIYANAPEAMEDVARLDPDYVWLPARFDVVKRLEASGWCAIFSGPRSVLLSRQPACLSNTASTSTAALRIFPGP